MKILKGFWESLFCSHRWRHENASRITCVKCGCSRYLGE